MHWWDGCGRKKYDATLNPCSDDVSRHIIVEKTAVRRSFLYGHLDLAPHLYLFILARFVKR